MKTRNFNTNTDNEEQWLTPPWIIESLGEFDLDPCAPHPSVRPWATAKNHFDKTFDGLSQSWGGRVWMNPPYGRQTFTWMARLREHGNGVALIFCRTETKGFHREIWKHAHGIYFFEGRLKFHTIDGNPAKNSSNAPSCLVAYGSENVESLFAFEEKHGGRALKLT